MPMRFIMTAWRIGTEGGDLLALFEEDAKPRVESLRGLPRYRVVTGEGTLLLGDLARRIETDDPVEAGVGEPIRCGCDLLLEHRHCGFLVRRSRVLGNKVLSDQLLVAQLLIAQLLSDQHGRLHESRPSCAYRCSR
jgi:hypothetical protein